MNFSQVNLGLIRLHAIANEFSLAYKKNPLIKYPYLSHTR